MAQNGSLMDREIQSISSAQSNESDLQETRYEGAIIQVTDAKDESISNGLRLSVPTINVVADESMNIDVADDVRISLSADAHIHRDGVDEVDGVRSLQSTYHPSVDEWRSHEVAPIIEKGSSHIDSDANATDKHLPAIHEIVEEDGDSVIGLHETQQSSTQQQLQSSSSLTQSSSTQQQQQPSLSTQQSSSTQQQLSSLSSTQQPSLSTQQTPSSTPQPSSTKPWNNAAALRIVKDGSISSSSAASGSVPNSPSVSRANLSVDVMNRSMTDTSMHPTSAANMHFSSMQPSTPRRKDSILSASSSPLVASQTLQTSGTQNPAKQKPSLLASISSLTSFSIPGFSSTSSSVVASPASSRPSSPRGPNPHITNMNHDASSQLHTNTGLSTSSASIARSTSSTKIASLPSTQSTPNSLLSNSSLSGKHTSTPSTTSNLALPHTISTQLTHQGQSSSNAPPFSQIYPHHTHSMHYSHQYHASHPPVRQGQAFDLSKLEPALRSQVTCPACKRLMADPRLTPCLHAACASCLRALMLTEHDSDKIDASISQATEEKSAKSQRELRHSDQHSVSSSSLQSLGSSAKISPQSSSTPSTTQAASSNSTPHSNQMATQAASQQGSISKGLSVLTCPACAEEVVVPNDVERMPPARLQMNLVDAAQIQLWASDPDAAPLHCTSCNEPAVSVCLDGCWLLCQFCHLAHPRLLATSRHQVKELSKVTASELHRPQPCSVHPDHSLVFFCLSCKTLVCSICLDDFHVHHPREAIDKAARTQRTVLSQTITKVQEKKLVLQAATHKVLQTNDLLQKRSAQTRENIHQHFSTLIEKLREREATLSNQVDSICHAKSTVLRLQLDSINYGINDMEEALDFSKKALEMPNDTEMLTIYPSVLARINSLCGANASNEPAEGPHIEFYPDHDAEARFLEHLEKLGTIRVDVPVVCSVNSIARGHGLHTAFVDQNAYAVIKTRDEDGTDIVHGGHTIQASVNAPDDVHIPSLVQDRQDGTYLLSYTPRMEGVHTVSIYLNGGPINGSPFKVAVHSRQIKHLGISLGKFGSKGIRPGCFMHPFGVAVDPKTKNIYVSDCEVHRIQVFNQEGTFVRSFGSYGSGPGEFHTPSGLSISRGGLLAVADTENHRVQLFKTDGAFIQSFGSFGSSSGQMNSPDSVTFDSHDNIYISEWGNHRIQVFKSDGTFLSKFGSQGAADGQFQFPRGLAVDYGNHILVADRNNHRIQIFSQKGVFILKFGSKGSGEGQFNAPNGVSVDADGHIFVTDFHNNRVQVFSSNGSYLHQFGSLGGTEGKLHGPRAIAIDSGGKLFVTEYGNQRVQIF
eukprot:TRINITY_DN6506_c0_g1_i6.p1 TRINITY_DN6506_c0_g1~~TRINITY_DN6506_c0_g1_i6.p1  ORF type:complete len:1320 (+),score=278.82 TRINITY_DN6506_c0_g1_i6:105-4064(+)